MAALKSTPSGNNLPLGSSQNTNASKENALPGGMVAPGQAQGLGADKRGNGGGGPRTTPSSKVEPSGFFNKFGSGKILPVNGTAQSGGAGGEGAHRKRRGTHDGVIGSAEREQGVSLLHFKPRATDSADQVRHESI